MRRSLKVLLMVVAGIAGAVAVQAQTTVTGPGPMNVGTTNAQPLILQSNNTNYVWLTPGGSVGIGTSTPGALLHVAGTGQFNGALTVGNGLTVTAGGASVTGNLSATGNGSIGGNLTVTGTTVSVANIPSGSSATEVVVWNTGNLERRPASGLIGGYAWLLTGNTLAGGEKLGSLNAQPLVVVTNNLERLRVTPTGDVGIGTNSPAALLHVAGTGRFDGALTVTSGGAAITGNVTVTGNLSATGNGSIGGNLAVTGSATVGSGLTVSGGLTVSSGGASVTGNVTVTGSGTFGNGVTITAGDLSLNSGAFRVGGDPGMADQILVSRGAGNAPEWWTLIDDGSGTIVVTPDLGTKTIKIGALNFVAQWNANQLQGNNVCSDPPSPYDVLAWDGVSNCWKPMALTAGTGITVTGLMIEAQNTNPIWNAAELQGTAIDPGLSPSSGDILQWDGTQWVAVSLCAATASCGYLSSVAVQDPISGDGTIGNPIGLKYDATTLDVLPSGELTAKNGDPIWNANQLQGFDVSSSAPAMGNVLVWNGMEWEPNSVTVAGAWSVNGNPGTDPAFNFLGTTDDQPLIIKTNGVERMRVGNSANNGYVGIGDNDPAFRLELPNIANAAGRGRANSWLTYSSLRWKEEVRPIENALDKVMRLRGYHFRWKPEYGGTEDIGFLAEEVAQVVPEVVSYEPDGQVAGMDYSRLVAVLVEAMKQQQQEIAQLRGLVEQLLQERGNRGSNGGSIGAEIHGAWLGQNIPNPFEGTTTIPYYIPVGVGRAELVVRDLGGRELRRVELPERGAHGQVTLEMRLLGSGTYEYALVLDGRVVAVKQMTLVR